MPYHPGQRAKEREEPNPCCHSSALLPPDRSERRRGDGSAFRIIKHPYEAAELERRIGELGWDTTVTAAPGPFYWGEATR